MQYLFSKIEIYGFLAIKIWYLSNRIDDFFLQLTRMCVLKYKLKEGSSGLI